MLTIADWFCCLNPRERSVLRSTIEAELLTVYVGVPKTLWDSFWLPFSPNGAALRSSFLDIYGLEIVTIVVDEEELEVVRPQASHLAYWVDWSVYILTPGAACLDGCGQSTFP